MASVWVKWRLSTFEYAELSINDVLGEVSRASNDPGCEARGESHTEKTYIVTTKEGVYVLCSRCCKTLGLLLHG